MGIELPVRYSVTQAKLVVNKKFSDPSWCSVKAASEHPKARRVLVSVRRTDILSGIGVEMYHG
jgi:hypothetical protein